MTIKKLLETQIKVLRQKNIDNPILKARLILAFTIKKNKEHLVVNENEEISKVNEYMYKKNIAKLLKNIPLQYITKVQEFMKLDFFVNKNVLIPRQETEMLVEEVINICKSINNPKILDLCTGSGAIAVSLFNYIENINIIASDISKRALKVAKINWRNNNYDKKQLAKNNKEIKFLKSDLFNNIDRNKKFDVIVSNPPYIKEDVIKLLSKEVQKEPKIALNGGQDGLVIYRKIITEAYEFLNKGGYLCLEIGYDQKEEIISLLNNTGKYENIYSKKDLEQNDRIVVCIAK